MNSSLAAAATTDAAAAAASAATAGFRARIPRGAIYSQAIASYVV